ncbi:uncharacterized protein JCM10292_003789 [Rhodotorula paludigena]|uniref:uncharacterized protein n=1 Tax=Rhodotorula paludigena TaxID=86838 RepID=UPI00316BF19B
MLPANMAPPRTPARRAKGSSSSSAGADELARAEVLELRLFAEKKEWIEDRIQFLSTLPPIDVVSPDPPERSPTTRDELEQWWQEHDRIETEIDAYDMGDLARMRQFARDKSKQELSPEDTDLIEITLTTLFAVDRLLHLLRQRRKALTLLGYRLQWEDSVASAWNAHRQILSDLPAYLAKARWTPTSFATSRSREPSAEPGSPTLPHSSSLASLSSSTTSLSASFSSTRTLANLALPASSHSSASSSSLSRTARAQLLALSLSSLSTHARTLSSSLVPASATHLDRLIDSSPTPLPESFLDAQDALEAATTGATDGLAHFAEELRAQHEAADALHARSAELGAAASAVEHDALAALAHLRTSSSPRPAPRAPTALEERLATLRSARPSPLALLDSLPSPTHAALAPDQPEHSRTLHEALREEVQRADEAVQRALRRVDELVRAEAAVSRAREALKRLEAADERLEGAEAFFERSAPPEVERDEAGEVRCQRGEAEERFEREWDARVREARGEEARREAKDAAGVVVRLREAGVANELRRRVKERAAEVSSRVASVERALDSEERRRRGVKAAREVLGAVAAARAALAEGVGTVLHASEARRWSEDGAPADADDDLGRRVLADVRSQQAALLQPATASVSSLVAAGNDLPLVRPLAEYERSVRDETERLAIAARLYSSVVEQARSVASFAADLEALETRLVALARDADELLASYAPSPAALDGLHSSLEQHSASLDRLLRDAHSRITFVDDLAFSAAKCAPFDLAAQDALVRSFVNRSSARASGLVDDVSRRIELVGHKFEARTWDEEADEWEGRLEELETRLKEIQGPARELESLDAATLADLVTRCDSLSLASSTLDASTLASSLKQLCASPSATSPPFSGYPERRTRLNALASRLAGAQGVLASSREQLFRTPKHRQAPAAGADARTSEALAERDVKHDESRDDAAGAGEIEAELEVLRRNDVDEPDPTNAGPLPDAPSVVDSAVLLLSEEQPPALQERRASADEPLEGMRAPASIQLSDVALDAALASQPQGSDTAAASLTPTLERAKDAAAESPATRSFSCDRHQGDPAQPPQPATHFEPAQATPEAGRRGTGCIEVEEQPALSLLATPFSSSNATPSTGTTFAATPLPSLAQGRNRSPDISADDDVFAAPASDDPFASSSLQHLPPADRLGEPERVVALRRGLRDSPAHEWLDASAVLQLPSLEDADEADKSTKNSRQEVDAVNQLSQEELGWTDLDSLEAEQRRVEVAARRVRSLAELAQKVDTADSALSDLLNAIDATTPEVPSSSPEPGCRPAHPLSEALVAASEAVTAVRVDAIPLIDDARVARAIGRIQESWSEMLSLVEDVRPRPDSAASTASSASSLRTPARSSSRLAVSRFTPSRPSSQATSRSSVTDSASVRSSRPSSASTTSRRESAAAATVPRTPRASRTAQLDASTTTPRRLSKSGLPAATPRRAFSPLPNATPTVAHPFSFDAPGKRDLSKSTTAIPRRSIGATPRRGSLAASTASPAAHRMQHTPSAVSRRTTLGVPATETPSSLRRSSKTPRSSLTPFQHISPHLSSSTRRATPPRKTQKYLPDMRNKLDREVGLIINALPTHVHVPIAIAEGRWTDESGVYKIGERLYFCRILRSKTVMVRVGGGWLNLLQFIISHFGAADGLSISPSTSLSKDLGNEPTWMNPEELRSRLAASTSSMSIPDRLALSVSSSTASTDLRSSTSSRSLRRSAGGGGSFVSGLASLRRSSGLGALSSLSAAAIPVSTPRPAKSPRPPVPVWRP